MGLYEAGCIRPHRPHRPLSAEGGTRTPTGLRPLRPERSASTSSTTSAWGEKVPGGGRERQRPSAVSYHREQAADASLPMFLSTAALPDPLRRPRHRCRRRGCGLAEPAPRSSSTACSDRAPWWQSTTKSLRGSSSPSRAGSSRSGIRSGAGEMDDLVLMRLAHIEDRGDRAFLLERLAAVPER